MSSKSFPWLKTDLASAALFLGRQDDFSMYLCYGKTDAWSDDNVPPSPNVTTNEIYNVWSNMIGAKRLLGGDFYAVVPRYDWTSGETYTAYDHEATTLENKDFYVVTEDFNVYKCLANNYGQSSTVKPTTLSPFTVQRTSDGYVWKYMYTISDAEQLRFTTDNYIPVKTVNYDDGSLQWQVQQQATPGSIEYIKITSAGSGYVNSINASVVVTGDGTGFVGTPVVNTTTGSIDSITILNTGRNYTYANVTISAVGVVPTSNAFASAMISPPGGHGSDALYELYASTILIDGRLRYNEEGVLPVTNDYRQISLISNPKFNPDNSSIKALDLGNTVANYPAILQAYTVTCSGTGNYSENETVYQGESLEKATFKAIVVSWNSTTNKLLLINTIGTLTVSQALIGQTSTTSRTVSSYDVGTLKPYTGHLLYVNHLKPIIRSSDQIEDFKILVKF